MRTAPHLPHPVVGALLPALIVALAAHAGDHPILLLSRADVPQLRRACGVAEPARLPEDRTRPGARSADFQALRAYFVTRPNADVLPGELPADESVSWTGPAGFRQEDHVLHEQRQSKASHRPVQVRPLAGHRRFSAEITISNVQFA